MRGAFGTGIGLRLGITTIAAAFSVTPIFAQFVNPIQAAKGAWKKANQELQGQPAAQPASAPANAASEPSTAKVNSSSAQPEPAGTYTTETAQTGTGAWQPPSGVSSPGPAALATPLDPAKLPDVLGIHMGEPREMASSALLKLYPGNSVRPEGPDTVAGMSMINIDLPGKSGADNVHLEFTLPPGKQRVYYIERGVFYKQPMSYDNVVAALRQKYGHELFVDHGSGETFWLFDEQGHLTPPDTDPTRTPYNCNADDASEKMLFHSQVNSYLHNELPPATFCDSLIVLRITIPQVQLVDRLFTVVEDRALLRREVIAAGELQKEQIQKQQKQNLNNAQQAKPVF